MSWAIFGILVSLVSFGVAAYFYYWVKSLDTAEGSISEIGNLIRKGAFTFLSREYRILSIFVGVVSVLIIIFFPEPFWKGNILTNLSMVIAYILGSVFSG